MGKIHYGSGLITGLLRKISRVRFDSSCRLADLADYPSIHRRRGHHRRAYVGLASEHDNAEGLAAQGGPGVPEKRRKRRYACASPETFSPGPDFCGGLEE